jgi:hypothetical protein
MSGLQFRRRWHTVAEVAEMLGYGAVGVGQVKVGHGLREVSP